MAYLDPSATANESSDYKALVVLATPTPNAKPPTQNPQPIFCLHAWIRHASPGEMVRHLFWVDEAFQPATIGCESNGFQTFIWELLDIEAQRIGRRLDVKPVNNRQNKHDRILANQGEFERGLCRFDPQEGDQRVLIDQFLDFGKPAVHDDGPDAWDGARRLLPARAGAPTFFYRGLPRRSPFAHRGADHANPFAM